MYHGYSLSELVLFLTNIFFLENKFHVAQVVSANKQKYQTVLIIIIQMIIMQSKSTRKKNLDIVTLFSFISIQVDEQD